MESVKFKINDGIRDRFRKTVSNDIMLNVHDDLNHSVYNKMKTARLRIASVILNTNVSNLSKYEKRKS